MASTFFAILISLTQFLLLFFKVWFAPLQDKQNYCRRHDDEQTDAETEDGLWTEFHSKDFFPDDQIVC